MKTNTTRFKMKESFNILSPDGFPISRDKEYKTEKEAWETCDKWIEGYKHQGYYSTIRNGQRYKMPIEEIKENCTLIKN